MVGWRWWQSGCGDSDGGVRVAVAVAWRWLWWCVAICGDDVDGMEMVVGMTMVLVMLLVRWCGGGAWRVGDDVGGDAWRLWVGRRSPEFGLKKRGEREGG
ncbi:hypothetical protein Tco_0389655 [Tanacetum coccineum]